MRTQTRTITISDSILYDTGYGERDADVELEFEVSLREVECDTPKGTLTSWEAYKVELQDACLWLIDSDGGNDRGRVFEPTKEELRKYSNLAELKALENL